ncbi:MAG: LrgB family protein [Clostridia bacterium]|nr:LrgB family protein [Oscillospiraceae bacterium]MBR6748361.1 LrgB family protein [Clostridia bacterium]
MNTILSTLTAPWYYGLLLTIGAFLFGRWLQAKTGWRWLNPMAVGMVLIIGLFLAFDLDFDTYNQSAQILTKLLGPATVALAIPLYRQIEVLKRHWQLILISVACGAISAMLFVAGMSVLLAVEPEVFRSIVSKSITTAIGIGVTAELGGHQELTIFAITLTGITGAILGSAACKLFRIRDRMAVGLAFGTSSHAIGTSRALEIGDIEGSMSGLAIVIAGVITVALAPWVGSWI